MHGPSYQEYILLQQHRDVQKYDIYNNIIIMTCDWYTTIVVVRLSFIARSYFSGDILL